MCPTGWRQPPPTLKFWPENLPDKPLVTLIWATGLFEEEKEGWEEKDTDTDWGVAVALVFCYSDLASPGWR